MTNPVANVKPKAKVTEGNLDFILSLGSTTGFVKEPNKLDMKNVLIASICLILWIGCGNEKAPSTTSGETATEVNSNAEISNLNASTYKSALDKSLESMPIDRLCKESKGYNQNEWEGKNACAWAVEKYRIEQHKDLVERKEGTLILQLDSGAIEMKHPMDEGTTSDFYYQFNGYIKSANAYYLLAQQKGQCPQYWIIDRKDGSKTILNGLPVFNPQQDAFVFSTASIQANSCSNDVEYWKLKSGKFVKSSSIKAKLDLYDIVWATGKTWFGVEKSADQKVISYKKMVL